MNLILFRNVCLSGKHADITELRWGEKHHLTGQLPCPHLHVFCLHLSAGLTHLSACVILSVTSFLLYCQPVCQPVLSIRPTLPHKTNNRSHPLSPTLHYWSPPPRVPFWISFFQFYSSLFFHVFREIQNLGSPSSYWSTGSPRPTSRGPDRGCLLSCYLSPS